MYVCTLPCKVIRVKIVTKHSVISRYLLTKNLRLRRKQFLSALGISVVYIVTVLWMFEVFTTRCNTRCQMVTPLLYCTCMMAWSTVNPSINSRGYCVYSIS